MPHAQRKRTYIDPQVQGALARRLIIHWTMFIVIAMVLAFCMQVLGDPLRSFGEHAQQAWWIHGPFFLILIALIPVFVRDSIKLSNRFAGPIYRLRKTIRLIAEGKPSPPLKFREADYWQDLAKDFNTMVQQLSKGTDFPEATPQESGCQEENLVDSVSVS